MSRVPRVVVDPKHPLSVVEHLARVQRVVDGDIEIGSPQDPRDPTSTTLANGAAHNGTVLNIRGSWVEVDVDTLNARVDCVHNLGAPVTAVAAVNQPNVRWEVFGFQHSGAGVGAGSAISCNYDKNDAASITANSFPLRFYAPARTVAAGANVLRVTLWFIPAIR